MNTPNDGGPAFPSPDGVTFNGNAGMSFRDWFAGQAFLAITTHPDGRKFSGDYEDKEAVQAWFDDLAKRYAEAAYRIADAMIKARGGYE